MFWNHVPTPQFLFLRFCALFSANVLERDADAEGKAYWIGQLEAGIEQGAVMVGIAESEESIQLFA